MNPWVQASRPKTLPAAVAPVIVGTALAAQAGAVRPLAAIAALLTALFLQIGANFHNDLYDFKHGADRQDRVGPTRVTSAGLLTPEAVERGTWVVFGMAAVCGLYLVYRGGWPILLLGIAAILSALAYTAGPFPLGYNGLGDLFVFLFFGLAAVVGTYYVQVGRLSPAPFVAALAMGALITNILVVNNVRDLEGDRVAGKHTMAVRLGRQGALAEFLVLFVAAYAVPFVLWLGLGFRPWVLLAWLSLVWAIPVAASVFTQAGPALNRALAGMGRVVALYGVLLALGVLL